MGALSFVLYNQNNPPVNKSFTDAFMNMKNRGPDDTVYRVENSVGITRFNEDQVRRTLSKREISEYTPFTYIYGYHRLSVNDLTMDAAQPFTDPILHKVKKYPELQSRPQRHLICNGEIYNYQELVQTEGFTDRDIQSNCDVEVILPMYIKYGLEGTLKKLNGDFNFILMENLNTFDLKTTNIFVVRDILGVKPLYIVKYKNNGTKNGIFYMFTSELKGIPESIFTDPDYQIREVPPGTFWSFQNSVIERGENEFLRYSDWNVYRELSACKIITAEPSVIEGMYKNLYQCVKDSVIMRYQSAEVPVGVLLSGGFDSSIVLSLIASHIVAQNQVPPKQLYAFTIGDVDEAEVRMAQECVKFLENKFGIDIIHHIITSTDTQLLFQRGILEETAYVLETYDPTTIRNGIPLSCIFKYIREHTLVKVLLTGEGLDELCGYHQLFESDDANFQRKSVRLLKNLSKYDLLKGDKLAGRYGLELRHPFLDRNVVEYILQIHPRLKRPQIYDSAMQPIEKYIVRKAFEADELLPKVVLWRTIQDTSECFNELSKQLQEYISIKYPGADETTVYQTLFDIRFNDSRSILPRYWDDIWN
uniref:Glutamine-dependent asparagine synthetase n=1 Tax=viral metagenome TaxID=1070528 RepID=A0A6C0H750_9ZZZZ